MWAGRAIIFFEIYLEKCQEMFYEAGIQIKHKHIMTYYSFDCFTFNFIENFYCSNNDETRKEYAFD